MTIHFEGLDLAGKSTVCNRLTARLPGSKIRHNTLIAENPVCLAADRLRKAGTLEDAALGALYFGALLHDIDAYRPSPANDLVIQDSTILLRSLAFHSILGNAELVDLFQSRLATHPRFGKSFFLTCDPGVRRQRLKVRVSGGNDSPEDHLLLTNPEQFFAIEAELRRLAVTYFDATILDASKLEDEDCSNQLLDQILAEIPTATTVDIEPDLLWQRGAKMAALFHLGQLRKDGQTP